jgi:hypothetical protein
MKIWFVLWLWYSEDVDCVVALEFVMKVWNCGVAVDQECVFVCLWLLRYLALILS